MITKVARGQALYGRISAEINLQPLRIAEVRQFLGKGRSEREAMEAQLALGGIPEYLKLARTESSVYLALCRHSFLPDSYFLNEHERVFISSLARNPNYCRIVDFLAKRKSATRSEISAHCRSKAGGTLSALLVVNRSNRGAPKSQTSAPIGRLTCN
ncbi:MAG: hypothetical protein HY717_17030 [Planctomycetes bacterium]|nr:hypothetical protein [Planctomycetota bacterium]